MIFSFFAGERTYEPTTLPRASASRSNRVTQIISVSIAGDLQKFLRAFAVKTKRPLTWSFRFLRAKGLTNLRRCFAGSASRSNRVTQIIGVSITGDLLKGTAIFRHKNTKTPEGVFLFLRAKGLEPSHHTIPDPKSGASANSATPACISYYTIIITVCQV